MAQVVAAHQACGRVAWFDVALAASERACALLGADGAADTAASTVGGTAAAVTMRVTRICWRAAASHVRALALGIAVANPERKEEIITRDAEPQRAGEAKGQGAEATDVAEATWRSATAADTARRGLALAADVCRHVVPEERSSDGEAGAQDETAAAQVKAIATLLLWVSTQVSLRIVCRNNKQLLCLASQSVLRRKKLSTQLSMRRLVLQLSGHAATIHLSAIWLRVRIAATLRQRGRWLTACGCACYER